MKVGFIIGPQGGEYQGTYYDKFKITSSRPWLQSVPKMYHIDDDGERASNNADEKYVRIDVAVAYCLKHKLEKSAHSVHFIPADKITNAQLRKYDLVINQFMDLLIVPFIKKYELRGIPHEKLRVVYEQNKDILYPPINYANLVYDKCAYYAYLRHKGISVAPTVCVTREMYKNNPSATFAYVAQVAIQERWGKIFAKPVHGTDSGDVKLLAKKYKVTKKTYDKIVSDIKAYCINTFKNKRYPSIVFQKYFKDFETTVPQIRMYYVGRDYQYSILNTSDGTIYRPQSEVSKNYNHEYTTPFRQLPSLKQRAQQVLDAIVPFFNGAPMLVTRIDFGCCLKQSGPKANRFFLNEIEFNPGMYLHADGQRKFNIDAKMANQLVRVVNHYDKQN